MVPRSSWTGGALNALLSVPAVGGNTLSTSGLGRFLVFVYIWLPFMILPVQAALERIPGSLLQASADLGAAPRQTFRYVVLPLAIPGIAAGSIFTFSLTLGDFIVPQLVARRILYRQYGLLAAGGDRQYADGGGVYPGAYRLDCPLSGVRETSGSLRCTLNARPGICDWRHGAG
ncbi:Spermidine Putrescine ABC transporter permease PotB [Klebsiella pneumoniae subsp. ozaenae]|uniref:Spermidine Putrescine ABC transporter permease PotB n=1 Tax=Klebsiella pneumoniae subsp. ozaenae TaxID=574 RepID=A0A377ZKB5_KLEPO|nr:Spermidine Putrescine ABC transporter permease PotB [Klebsiella pneumoniae subsp. ozaenae]